MEMTPIDPRDNSVSSGDGATPHGRDLSSTSETKEEKTYPTKLKDIAKTEIPVDQTAETIAAMLRRADPNLDAETARLLAKKLLDHTPPVQATKPVTDPPAVGTTLDVSA